MIFDGCPYPTGGRTSWGKRKAKEREKERGREREMEREKGKKRERMERTERRILQTALRLRTFVSRKFPRLYRGCEGEKTIVCFCSDRE